MRDIGIGIGRSDSLNKTTWHVNPQHQSSGGGGDKDDVPTGVQQAQKLTSLAARRVWEELYVSKKPAIEEAFKTSLGSNTANRAPSLELAHDNLREPAQRLWLVYMEAERRCAYRAVLEVPNQIQSKIQKVTGGLTRLASRSKTKRDETIVKTRSLGSLSWADVFLSTQNHLIALKEQVDAQWKTHQQAQQHAGKYVGQHWQLVQAELVRERGVWGSAAASRLDKWMLDATEGPCRMRKKLTPNAHFYVQYPYRPELECGESRSLKYKVATSVDCKDYHRFYANWKPILLADKDAAAAAAAESKAALAVTDDSLPLLSSKEEESAAAAATAVQVSEQQQLEDGLAQLKDLPKLMARIGDADDEEADSSAHVVSLESVGASMSSMDESVTADQPQDSQNLLRLLEDGEKIGHLFRCARVEGLDTVDGLLLFGTSLLIFLKQCLDNFNEFQ